jgi:hypothetical protein
MKFRPVRAELSHADGQKDMKLILAFRNFANISNTDGMCLDGLRHAAAAADGGSGDLGAIKGGKILDLNVFG